MIYSFEDQETGEEFELQMSYEELKQFLVDNPKVNQTFVMNIVDPVGAGISKPPSDFQKGIIGRIKDGVPGAKKDVLEKRFTVPREW